MEEIGKTCLSISQKDNHANALTHHRQARATYQADVSEFTLAFNIVQRRSWFLQLSRRIEGVPRKYPSDKWKILGAMACLCDDFRAKWSTERRSKSPEERKELETTWQLFVDWTLTLLPWKWFGIEVKLMWMLERAQQMPPRDPKNFQIYLIAIETEVDRLFKDRPEKRSALAFFAKLQPDLQREMYKGNNLKLPENRYDIASLAHRCWVSSTSAQKREPKRRRNNRRGNGRRNR